MRKFKLQIDALLPVIMAVVVFAFFSIGTGGKFTTAYNIKNVLNSMFPVLLGGFGLIFVLAQGSIDISQGQVVLVAGTVAAILSNAVGVVAAVVAAMAIGAIVGLINGILVARFKVQSLMATLATQLALKGFSLGTLNTGTIFCSTDFAVFKAMEAKAIIVALALLVMTYIFMFTKLGIYSKAIGENEVVLGCSGIRVTFYKTMAFMFAGITAGLASVIILANSGAATTKMGSTFSIDALIALFLGGTPVNGGMGTKMYKLLLGTVTICMLENGLTLLGVSSEIYQAIEGVLLLAMLILLIYIKKGSLRIGATRAKAGRAL